ncbi:MAG: hypothetical protein A2511_14230 [Deltaproteobacteria bacterium RIFOXYD12_FULL_50_9]|nr:MAG: hypothetical protein A2511_14230 [Deltaproteobacteria bacterium RIFOXYD12_FULL_50_9]
MQVQRLFEKVNNRNLLIELPESFINHQVEVIVLTVDDEKLKSRRPHPAIAGKIQICGDIFESTPESYWDLPR